MGEYIVVDRKQFDNMMKVVVEDDKSYSVVSHGFLWLKTSDKCYSPDKVQEMLEVYYNRRIRTLCIQDEELFILFN